MSDRTALIAPGAPKAIGPYSHAVRAGGLVFVSGMIGIDPASSKLVEGGVAAEAEQAIRNLRAVLEVAGSRPELVVKATVYLIDMDDFAAVNRVYGETFS